MKENTTECVAHYSGDNLKFIGGALTGKTVYRYRADVSFIPDMTEVIVTWDANGRCGSWRLLDIKIAGTVNGNPV